MTITKQDIEQDIEGYEQRILGIRKNLFKLPARGRTGKENWKIKNTRRKLLQEIEHVERLKSWALEALEG